MDPNYRSQNLITAMNTLRSILYNGIRRNNNTWDIVLDICKMRDGVVCSLRTKADKQRFLAYSGHLCDAVHTISHGINSSDDGSYSNCRPGDRKSEIAI